MSIMSMPKMLVSDTEGWGEVVRFHPSVNGLLLFFVAPMSLIPAIMYPYAQMVHPGAVFPLLEPPLRLGEALLVGGTLFLIEMAMVLMMANFIRQTGESVGARPHYENALALAAIAPTPLWLSSLALFVPSLWFNVAVVALAWVASVALIRHGVRPLFELQDEGKARKMAAEVTAIGVTAWLALLVVMALVVSLFLGWH